MKPSQRFTLIAAAFAIVATSSTLADTSTAPSLVVKSTGLDLKTDQGMREMYARIEHAAQQLCSNITAREMPRQRQLFKQCVDNATSNAVASLEEGTFRRYAQNRLDSRAIPSRG
jgi:UrcA family protein